MNKSTTVAYYLSQNNFHGGYVLSGTPGCSNGIVPASQAGDPV